MIINGKIDRDDRTEFHGDSIWSLTDRLGEKLDRAPVERPEPITSPIAGFTRKDLWPADVWAEMQAIRRGDPA